jgi:hypothetical protein
MRHSKVRTRFDTLADEDCVETMGTNIYSSKDNQSLHKSLNGGFCSLSDSSQTFTFMTINCLLPEKAKMH